MVWLIGNKGMLGTELSELLIARSIEFIGTDREISILDPRALVEFASGKNITCIINCAAYTAVDKAEDEEELARELNAKGPYNIACLAKQLGARFIHISTDYVFAGTGSQAYTEDMPVAPVGAYGRTKAEGEQLIQSECPDAIIVRTAWLYGKHGPNFVETMLRLMKERRRIGVVADQYGSPTWAFDLAAMLANLVVMDTLPCGIYHYSNEGQTTWHGFAKEINRVGTEAGILSHRCEIEALTSDQYPTKAQRPAWSVLSKHKIKSIGIRVPDWQESLKNYIYNLYRKGL